MTKIAGLNGKKINKNRKLQKKWKNEEKKIEKTWQEKEQMDQQNDEKLHEKNGKKIATNWRKANTQISIATYYFHIL